jgi:phospholipase C
MTVAGQRVSQGFFERREPRLVVAPLIEARAEEPTTSATMSRTASCRRCPGSTVSIENELVTNATPIGPIGLGVRVPFLAVSPWSKGGYVNSEVFDHTSVIQFIEKRFGVHEINISPWRRAVTGDLTSVFNFVNPNASHVNLPSTDGYLPPQNELAGGNVATFEPTLSGLIIGVPKQERGVRPARALPYQLDVHASVVKGTVTLDFSNTGKATAVFQVRSGNAADPVRNYTVEPGKKLAGAWSVTSSYDLSVLRLVRPRDHGGFRSDLRVSPGGSR